MNCVCCGRPCQAWHYCSVHCAEAQLRTLGALLHSTPRWALSVEEWHDLSASYATDLEQLRILDAVVA